MDEYSDPYIMAGFDNETAQRLRDVQRHTGVPAQSVIAFYKRFRRIPDGRGASAMDPVAHAEELKKSAGCGEWIDMSDKYDHGMDLRCSICRERASSFVGGREDWWDMWKPNYCPHCGAKMDGGKDATD